MSPRKRRSKRKSREAPAECFYCKQQAQPDYKDWEILGRFLTPRGKIIGRQRSGLCAKHQRELSVAVKRAREVALL